jgi:hypothetical protein
MDHGCRRLYLGKIKVLGLGIEYTPKPTPTPNTYTILGT